MAGLLKNDDFRDQFITTYLRHMQTTFAPERMNEVLDGLCAEIEPELDRQCKRWKAPTQKTYQTQIKYIKSIIDQKPAMARKQIKEAFRLTDDQLAEYEEQAKAMENTDTTSSAETVDVTASDSENS